MLVVDDDRALRDAVSRALRLEGYETIDAADGAQALAGVEEHRPDVVLLDLGLPVVDGLTVCQVLRTRGDQTPILVLTARHEVSDRVRGLDAGADDFMSKPFALEELLARLRALLRRTAPPNDDADDTLHLADLRLSPGQRRVWRGERRIDLTKTEFDLLELLLSNAGVVLSRGQNYEDIWGFDFESSSNSLDVYIGYLRRKTEQGDAPRLIQTVRGVGYVLRPA